ncbi:MAG TPA: AsmA family protein [Bryobacteraceae bacterium]|jgi:hypothetical protein|nr:AsmA family protein [Bryobacteraceae bacterium]
MKRAILILLALILIAGFGAPYLDADFMRPRIERALERGLGRKVEVGKVYFNLFTGPGFAVEDVTIYEDPRAGIEPFAYVGLLEARVRLTGLLSHRLEFSSLRLGDASINLVKTGEGPWNFQFLLSSAPATAGAMPAIRMRGGRVNFKFGDTKSVFYFSDADFDVTPWESGNVDLRFSGAPSRTDRAAQNFGHFFVRGQWNPKGNPQALDMRVELERSPVEEVARLLDQRAFNVHGVVAFDARLAGPPSHLGVEGRIDLSEVRRADLLSGRGVAFGVPFKGTLDLRGDRLELSTIGAEDSPVALKFRSWDFLSRPQWDAEASLEKFPLASLLSIARQMGAALPEKLKAEGSASGEVRYAEAYGVSGRIDIQNAALALTDVPGAGRLLAESASLAISNGAVSLASTPVQIGDNESAEIEGDFAPSTGLDLRIATRGLSVADLRSFGLSSIPLLEQTPQGSWRGFARYRWTPGSAGEWSGEYELQNARIAVDGLADPLRIQTAAVVSSGPRLAISRMRARAGSIAFTGEYHWDPAAIRPHKFKLDIPSATAAEIERLLAPALIRERGFLARTLRLGPAPAPEWLESRRADGTISVEDLAFGETHASISGARLLWDGAQARLARLAGQIGEARVNGELAIDLSGRAPHYRFVGKLDGVAYKGGELNLEGSLEAAGAGADLLHSAQGEAHFKGAGIAFSPEAEFRKASGCLELLGGLRWKISDLEVVQGAETLTGSGVAQPDGRVVLDLTVRGRQIRYTSALAPVGSQ